MPHKRLHHPPHGPNGHRAHHDHERVAWVVNDISRSRVADFLSDIAAALSAGSQVTINDDHRTVVVNVPDGGLEFELKHERTHHGSKAIVIHAEWYDDDSGNGIQPVAVDGLKISPTPAV